jgi:hypothetical protein
MATVGLARPADLLVTAVANQTETKVAAGIANGHAWFVAVAGNIAKLIRFGVEANVIVAAAIGTNTTAVIANRVLAAFVAR